MEMALREVFLNLYELLKILKFLATSAFTLGLIWLEWKAAHSTAIFYVKDKAGSFATQKQQDQILL